MNQSRINRGFSLIEVLIALCVMSVGVLGLLRLQTEVDKRAETARHQTEALYLAENHLEDLRRRSLSGPVTNSSGVVVKNANTEKFADINDLPPLSVDSYTLVREVEEIAQSAPPGGTAPLPFAKHIKVTVSWLDREQNSQSIVLQTVIAAGSEFD